MYIVVDFNFKEFRCRSVIEPLKDKQFKGVYGIVTAFYDENGNAEEISYNVTDKEYVKNRLYSCRRRKGIMRLIKEDTITYRVDYSRS